MRLKGRFRAMSAGNAGSLTVVFRVTGNCVRGQKSWLARPTKRSPGEAVVDERRWRRRGGLTASAECVWPGRTNPSAASDISNDIFYFVSFQLDVHIYFVNRSSDPPSTFLSHLYISDNALCVQTSIKIVQILNYYNQCYAPITINLSVQR